MELIDRRKLVSDFWKGVEDCAILSYEDTDELMENAPTVDAVEVSRLGRLGQLMMPYPGCPRGMIGHRGEVGGVKGQSLEILELDPITDIDGNRWVPVLDSDLAALKDKAKGAVILPYKPRPLLKDRDPNNLDVYCPECGTNLSGYYGEESLPIVTCFFCGEILDPRKAATRTNGEREYNE